VFLVKKRPNLIILCSHGGSVLSEISKFFSNDIHINLLTDRNCDAENIPNISKYRIVDTCNESLSKKILIYAKEIKADGLLMFFSRLITSPLIDNFSCFNVHPSLLPKYPGMGAEKKAYINKDSVIGSTLHLVDDSIDKGKIIFQCQQHVQDINDFESYRRSAFLSKVRVSFLFCEVIIMNGINNIEPYLKLNENFKTNEVKAKFDEFLMSLK